MLATKNDEVGPLNIRPILPIMQFFIIFKPTPYFKGVATVYFDLTWTPIHSTHTISNQENLLLSQKTDP